MKALLLATLALTGCSQILGLEDTKFDQRDAMVDAPTSCDAAPRCTSASGRSVCGQLWGTADKAGALVRADAPSGDTCANLNSTTGPCGYQIYGQSLASYYANNAVDRIVGEIDDCGRFVVPDLDMTAANVVVVVTGTDIVESAAALFGRPTSAGEDRNVALPVIASTTPAAWAMQVDSTNPPTLTGGYLVTYVNATGAPIATQELRVNGGAVGDPPTVPWGAYFSGAGAYGPIDPAATATGASGSALVVPSGSTFMLGGFRTGKNCTPVSAQPHPTAFVHVALSC